MKCNKCLVEFYSSEMITHIEMIEKIDLTNSKWGISTFHDYHLCHDCAIVEQKQYDKRIDLCKAALHSSGLNNC